MNHFMFLSFLKGQFLRDLCPINTELISQAIQLFIFNCKNRLYINIPWNKPHLFVSEALLISMT